MIVDVHGNQDGPRSHRGIPDAVCIDPHRLGQHDNPNQRARIRCDREVVLYSAAPHELTCARVALELRRREFERVRRRAGGLQAWTERGFPLTPVMLCGGR